MTPNTIIAKHVIKDHMLSNGLTPHTITISHAIIKYFRLARQKYYIHLEEEKKMEMRARLTTDDIDTIKFQQKDLSKTITMTETKLNM